MSYRGNREQEEIKCQSKDRARGEGERGRQHGICRSIDEGKGGQEAKEKKEMSKIVRGDISAIAVSEVCVH